MDNNVTDEATYLELKMESKEVIQSRLITRQMNREMELNQATILQPVSSNGAGRKAKAMTETREGGKEWPGNITALKLIAKQRANEKAQLEEWKADLMSNLESELVEVQIMHDEAMKTQYWEIKKQCEHFTLEVEAWKEMLKEVKENKTKNVWQDEEKGKKSLEKENEPIGKEEKTTSKI